MTAPPLDWRQRALPTFDSPDGRPRVRCVVRRRPVILTPEEEVRQQLIWHLHLDCGVPLPLIAVERGLLVHRRRKRFDLLVFGGAQSGHSGLPLLLAECKAPSVALAAPQLQQAAVYNSRFGASHLLITNGHTLLLYTTRFGGEVTLRREVPQFVTW
jgi:hypothetical protein